MYSHVVSVKDLKVVFAAPVDASKTLTPASNVVFALSAATSNAPTPTLAAAVKFTAKYAALPAARMAANGFTMLVTFIAVEPIWPVTEFWPGPAHTTRLGTHFKTEVQNHPSCRRPAGRPPAAVAWSRGTQSRDDLCGNSGSESRGHWPPGAAGTSESLVMGSSGI